MNATVGLLTPPVWSQYSVGVVQKCGVVNATVGLHVSSVGLCVQ